MHIDSVLRTRPSRLVTIRMNDTLLSAARRLRAENIGLLVVKDTCATEGDAVLGVVSERDVLSAIVDDGPAALRRSVASVMTPGVVCCQLQDTAERALDLMQRNQLGHLPVLHDGVLVGVVSLRDLMTGREAAETAELAMA